MLMGSYIGITMPFLYHIVSERTSPEGRAKAIGLIGAFNFLGAFLNPFIFAPVGAALGIHGAFIAAGIFMGLAALGLVFAGRGLAHLKPAEVKH
jgi:MFS family permease